MWTLSTDLAVVDLRISEFVFRRTTEAVKMAVSWGPNLNDWNPPPTPPLAPNYRQITSEKAVLWTKITFSPDACSLEI